MNIETKVRILSTLTTRDTSGRHFTSRVSDDELAELEADGLIEVSRPVHEATGIPYAQEHWAVTVTDDGVELVAAYPEYHAAE